MFPISAILLLFLFTPATLATPIGQVSQLRAARAESRLLSRQEQQALSTPVRFQTVTTTQTQAGLITTTCDVTLSPVTAADGSTQVLQEKQCKVQVGTGVGSSPSPSSNGGGNNTSQTSTPASTETATQTQGQGTQTLSSSSSSATATSVVPAISQIGVGTIPASATGTVSAPSSAQTSASATASGSAPPAVSVIGTGQIPTSATGTVSPGSSSGTTPITSLTTLSDGQVSTSVSTPSAAAAEQAAATTPGQKLEVLPIGLGVFAGVSVIALIVVGLVTYERTKYRKAFRQRKLAEAGANMGYGGMAERT